MTSPITIDGTTLEGGGQLLRLALGVSALTTVPVFIDNIRGKRPGGGGLKGQHLTCALWLGKACAAGIQGAALKSKSLAFAPREQPQLAGLDFTISQSTPGAIGLVFQAILPFLLFSAQPGPLQVIITGGTNVSASPSLDYLEQVLAPMLKLIGVPPISIHCSRRGWSQGGVRIGSAEFTVTPFAPKATLPAFNLTERGDISFIDATVIAPRPCHREIETRLRDQIHATFPGVQLGDLRFEDSHHEKRFYLLAVATSTNGIKLGRDWLYDKRINPDRFRNVMSDLVSKVLAELRAEIQHNGCADEYMRDQLVVFQALAKGQSRVYGGRTEQMLIPPSLHAMTAQWVVGKLLGTTFDANGTCEGIGFKSGEEFAGLDSSTSTPEESLCSTVEQLEI